MADDHDDHTDIDTSSTSSSSDYSSDSDSLSSDFSSTDDDTSSSDSGASEDAGEHELPFEIANDETREKRKVKKHERQFELYIHRTLRSISMNNNSMSKNARKQFNSVMCALVEKITHKAFELNRYGNHKTVHVAELMAAVQFIFVGKLLDMANKAALAAMLKYFGDRMYEGVDVNSPLDFDTLSLKKKSEVPGPHKKTHSRQTKAGLIFSPALCERYLREQHMNVSHAAPIYLAAVLEYFASELLILTCKEALKDDRVRLTVRDLALSVLSDDEFNRMFINNHMAFVANVVTPYMGNNVLGNMNKPFARNIINLQQTGDSVLMSRYAVDRLIRSSVDKYMAGTRVSRNAISYIQYIAEQEIVNTLRHAAQLAEYAKHSKVTAADIELTLAIKEGRSPVFDEL